VATPIKARGEDPESGVNSISEHRNMNPPSCSANREDDNLSILGDKAFVLVVVYRDASIQTEEHSASYLGPVKTCCHEPSIKLYCLNYTLGVISWPALCRRVNSYCRYISINIQSGKTLPTLQKVNCDVVNNSISVPLILKFWTLTPLRISCYPAP
jgi:hypothetical protein